MGEGGAADLAAFCAIAVYSLSVAKEKVRSQR